ncbi:uncharacterized protein LOC116110025 [Pistacia vera]|uniref:uncharacterized protein LOC116110025 n=1 Tax=Pistacia vera TaxID=55513 RepID=UPI0012630948|nr:uncharacterized protein LOC116110025 [Pistacia vera]
MEYRTRLNATVDCIRFLLRQGLTFRGHDESYDSNNQGNFLELLQFLANHNEDYNVVALNNALDNLKLTSPEIQNDIVSAIIRDLADSLFAMMIDESRDISRNEQMAIVLRYVNKNGLVVECFLGVEHVTSTTTLSLKATLDNFFSRHGLSFFRLRGQGYDGASNMQAEFNGLKTLVLKENGCAYYIHCFAHQLHASSKRCDLLRDKQACKVIEALSNGELSSGKSLNQKAIIQRASDTRWGSHYGIFGFTNELSQALQKKDQDIVNAMNLVEACKQALQLMRDNGWETLLSKVYSFCANHDIDVPNMDDKFFIQGRSQRKAQDMQLEELNNRLNEVNTELLICLACLCPNESFVAFDKQKLIRLAELYPDDFSYLELMTLDSQLDVYILDMHSNIKFIGLKGIGDPAKMMVETKKDRVLEALTTTIEEPEEGVTAQHRRDRAAYDIWKKKNSTARITLLSSMDNDLMKKYWDYKLAKDMWSTFATKFGGMSITKLRSLTIKFDTYKKKPEHNMRVHLRHLSNMISELIDAGHVLTDEQQVQAVIRSLPQNWEHMKIHLTHNEGIINLEDVICHLELEEDRLNASKANTDVYMAGSSSHDSSQQHDHKRKDRSVCRGISTNATGNKWIYVGNNLKVEVKGIGTCK